MKNLVSFILCLIFSFQFSFGQLNGSSTTDVNTNTYDYYYLKHKKQKKIGWILLGAGMGAAVIGTASSFNSVGAEGGSGDYAGVVIAGIGVASVIVSIPFFNLSRSNKRMLENFDAPIEIEPEPSQEKYDFYSRKQQKQKKIGWILFGSGLTLAVTTTVVDRYIYGNNSIEDYNKNSGLRAGLILAGLTSTLVSVPFLISSCVNKKKANVFLGSESIGFNANPSFNTNYLTLGLLIDI